MTKEKAMKQMERHVRN